MSNNLLSAAAGYYASLDTTSTYVEDVFSTYLYTGNGSGQTIANGIELSGQRDFSSALWGADAYVTSPNTNIDNFSTGPFTVELWLFHNSSAPDGAYATFFDNGGQKVFLSYGSSTNNLLFYSSSGQTNSTGFAHGMANNTWNHVAFVRDGTEGRIFVNGTRIGTETITNNYDLSGTGTTYINAYSGSFTGYNTNSYWSDFRVVKGYALYDADFDPPTEPLQVIEGTTLLMFQGGSGATTDHSGTRTLTLTGSVTTSTAKPVSGFTPEPGNGGMVWFKGRTGTVNHALYDTERGTSGGYGIGLISNTNGAEITGSANYLTTFNSNGFTTSPNGSGTYTDGWCSWTFRKAPRFFDVVTYTGDGVAGANAQAISHNLGVKPGAVIVKRTDSTGDWWVFTDVIDGSNDYAYLNGTQAFGNSANDVATSSVFNVGGVLNTNNAEYVAYLFANNNGDGRFGENNDQDIIKIGTFSGASGTRVELGFEPQFILHKAHNTSNSWGMQDNMRGLHAGTWPYVTEPYLLADTSAAEVTSTDAYDIDSTGFTWLPSAASSQYFYIAIRRGPMKTPTDASKLFSVLTLQPKNNGEFNHPHVTDMSLYKYLAGSQSWAIQDRLRGPNDLQTNETTNETGFVNNNVWNRYQNGWYNTQPGDNAYGSWAFRRAPGFFDVVAYDGNGGANATQNISHNLGIAPELLIVKARDSATDNNWFVYTSATGASNKLTLNSDAASASTSVWGSTEPTSSVFTVGNSASAAGANQSNIPYISYLFGTVEGVSKVGSFVGDGTNGRVIDCGFSGGARFVMMKKTSTTGNWIVYDTVHGISTSNDPYLFLNTPGGQVTSTDYIEPDSSGFAVNSSLNVNGVTWIFLAIA